MTYKEEDLRQFAQYLIKNSKPSLDVIAFARSKKISFKTFIEFYLDEKIKASHQKPDVVAEEFLDDWKKGLRKLYGSDLINKNNLVLETVVKKFASNYDNNNSPASPSSP